MASHRNEAAFSDFFETSGPCLRHAFIARYGPEVGTEVMEDVAEYAWRHWEKLSHMDNPAGWLFRVGQSRSRHYFRRPVRFPGPRIESLPMVEPALPRILQSLPVAQRTAVLLTKAFGYTEREAAAVLGVRASTVHQNTRRGLERLRTQLGVPSDA